MTSHLTFKAVSFLFLLLCFHQNGLSATAKFRFQKKKTKSNQPSILNESKKILNSYQHLNKSKTYKQSNLGLSLHHLKLAKKENPAAIAPFISFHEADIYQRLGQYKEALTILEAIQNLKVWDKNWQRKILAKIFECHFYLGSHAKFIALFKKHKRNLMRDLFFNETLFLSSTILEKKHLYKELYEILEKLVISYPVGLYSRLAFTKLLHYSCFQSHKPSFKPYTFSYKTLVKIAANQKIDAGLRAFVLAQTSNKIKYKRKIRHLNEDEQVQYLFDTKLYPEADSLAKTIFQGMNNKTPLKRKKTILNLLARIANRQNRPKEALKYYSLFVQLEENKAKLKTKFLIADSLTYGGFYKTAASVYNDLQFKTRSKKDLWKSFWNTYRSNSYNALNKTKSTGSRSLPHRDGFKFTSTYWKAKIFEKKHKIDKAKKIYKHIVAKNSDDIFSNIITSKFPSTTDNHNVFKTSNKQSTLLRSWNNPNLGYNLDPQVARSVATIKNLIKYDLLDEAKSLLHRINMRKIKIRDLPIIQNLAMRSGSYHLLHRISKRYLLNVDPEIKGWNKILFHQKKYNSIWRSYYPVAYSDIVANAAKKYHIDEYLLLSIMRVESTYKENALSYVGARGLMQIMPYTAQRIAEERNDLSFRLSDLNHPHKNIDYGAWYLRRLMDYYNNNIVLTVAAYNGGPKAVNSWLARCQNCDTDEFIESITFRETRRYVKKVVKHFARHKRIYNNLSKIHLRQKPRLSRTGLSTIF